MRPMMRADEFKVIQRESTRVAALLRNALFSIRPGTASSLVQGGFSRSPSPSGGSGLGLVWAIRTNSTRTYYLGTVNVTDRRNSTLRCYFRHSG
jgi:hypothetical protein